MNYLYSFPGNNSDLFGRGPFTESAEDGRQRSGSFEPQRSCFKKYTSLGKANSCKLEIYHEQDDIEMVSSEVLPKKNQSDKKQGKYGQSLSQENNKYNFRDHLRRK